MHDDTLWNALRHALDVTGGAVAPVAVVNACGMEDPVFVKQSDHACYNFKYTLEGVFNTILIRATRQVEETLGLVAMATDHLAPAGRLLIAQENAHGAAGLEKHLARGFGPGQVIIKHKCRVMVLSLQAMDKEILEGWRQRAALQKVERTGLWSQPGLFSWDRVDAGSRLLLDHLPERLEGAGADLGCGYGYLSAALARKPGVSALYALDIDRRAVDACTRNVIETGIAIAFHPLWRDGTRAQDDLPKLDWVATNPPFHTQQREDRALGQAFCLTALSLLKPRGNLYLVANRHMPYEALLADHARSVACVAEADGFKILHAVAR